MMAMDMDSRPVAISQRVLDSTCSQVIWQATYWTNRDGFKMWTDYYGFRGELQRVLEDLYQHYLCNLDDPNSFSTCAVQKKSGVSIIDFEKMEETNKRGKRYQIRRVVVTNAADNADLA